jgi:membrane fusion protein (multidrug efflux system)
MDLPPDVTQPASGVPERRAVSDAHDDQPGGEDQDKPDDAAHADEETGPPLYQRPKFWIILIIIVVVASLGGTLYWLHARQYESTDDAFVDAHIVRIAAEVQGKLTFVARDDNRRVSAGTLLARIEANAADASLDQAKAQAAQSVAGIEQAQAQVIAARAQAEQARAQARDPEAQAAKAAADLLRYLALQRLDPAAVAGTQIDQARQALQSANAQAAAARRAVDQALAQVRVAQKAVSAQRAQKAGAEAQIRAANVTTGHLDVRAPVNGQVVNRSVNLGSYVSPGTQMMAIVPDDLYITANFKETQLTLMRVGQHVDIHIDAFPDVHFVGHVDSIQRGAGQAFALLPPQNATGNYVKVVQRVPVRIVFERPGPGSPDPHRYAIGPGVSVEPTVKVR